MTSEKRAEKTLAKARTSQAGLVARGEGTPVSRSRGRDESPEGGRGPVSCPIEARRRRRVAVACNIYRARLDRAIFFQPALFGDAAWDTLLAVYVFRSAGRTLSAGELCEATCDVSLTSSLRMQRRLCDLRMVRRVKSPGDRRRTMVELTDEGARLLERYFDHIIDRQIAPEAFTPVLPELVRWLDRSQGRRSEPSSAPHTVSKTK